MITVIRNGDVYAPTYLGKKDIAIIGTEIAAIDEHIQITSNVVAVKEVDATGKMVVPGFIDSHVHILGGGGEGGYYTRTPEIQLSSVVRNGITTLVGVIGTDRVTRQMGSLVAKAKALEEEGITCYVQSGSYQVPIPSLTDSLTSDLVLIDRIIGAGEIAISDHRSSQPTVEMLAKVVSETRVGGMLSGKSGVVNIHVGDGKKGIDLLNQLLEETDIPIRQLYPTHMNRNQLVFKQGMEYALKGGYIDFTTSTTPQFLASGEVKCSEGLKQMLSQEVPIEQITFSSDAHGSLPEFDENGNVVRLKVGDLSTLFKEVRDAILIERIPVNEALKVITENPAKVLKLHKKGTLERGKDADIVLLSKGKLVVTDVWAKGKQMVQDSEILVKGTYE